jgi:hypothetical protein
VVGVLISSLVATVAHPVLAAPAPASARSGVLVYPEQGER